MINFNKVSIKNYQSISDTDLEIIPGKHLVTGRVSGSSYTSSNGAGKSSLLEAIPFALYGDTSRGGEIPRRGVGNCSVTVDLDINSDNYIITRHNSHSEFGNGVELIVSGEDVSSRGIRRVNKDIISALGVDFNLFSSSLFIMQGFPVNLCSMTPTVRKSIIESMMGLLVWEEYSSVFSSAKKEESKILNTNESVFTSKREEMISLYSEIESIKKMSEVYGSEIKDNINKIKVDIHNLTIEEDKISAEISKVSEESLQDLKSRERDISNKINKCKNRLSDINSTLDNNVCPTCNQSYPEDRIISLKDESKKISDTLKILSQNNKETLDKISKLEDLVSLKRDIFSKRSSMEKLLVDEITKFRKISESSGLSDKEDNLNKINNEVNTLLEVVQESKNNVDGISDILSTLTPSSKFRTQMVSRNLIILNNILEELSSIIFGDKIISLIPSSNGAGIDISIIDKRSNLQIGYKSFSGGERRRIDILLVFAIQRFFIEASSLESNLFVLDECTDGLDNVGCELVFNAMDSIYGQDKCVLVISHNNSFKSLFSSYIDVENTEGESHVDYTNYRAN